MSEHTNNVCNLSTLDGKTVKLISTDNYGVTQSLSDTGDVVVLRTGDRHDIYIAGEQIAGGYGFDDDANMDRLNQIASYYTPITYLNDKYVSFRGMVAEYEAEHNGTSDDGEVDTDTDNTSFVIGNTTYTLVNEDGKLLFDKQCETSIKDVTYKLDIDEEYIVSENPLVLKSGTTLKLNTITLNIEGTNDITNLDIYSYSLFNSISSSKKYAKKYTEFDVDADDFTSTYTISDNNYTHTETDGSNVSTLSITHTGKKNDDSDAVVIAMKDDTMSYPGMPKTTVSQKIYWELPYQYGIEEDNLTSDYRKDMTSDTFEITVVFDTAWANRTAAFFACPTDWGTPTFTHKDTGMKQPWSKVNDSPVEKTIEGTTIKYNIYKTNVEYYNTSITWIVKKD